MCTPNCDENFSNYQAKEKLIILLILQIPRNFLESLYNKLRTEPYFDVTKNNIIKVT